MSDFFFFPPSWCATEVYKSLPGVKKMLLLILFACIHLKSLFPLPPSLASIPRKLKLLTVPKSFFSNSNPKNLSFQEKFQIIGTYL